MDTYQRNIATLRKCQLACDSMEPPEYWMDDEGEDEPDEAEGEDNK